MGGWAVDMLNLPSLGGRLAAGSGNASHGSREPYKIPGRRRVAPAGGCSIEPTHGQTHRATRPLPLFTGNDPGACRVLYASWGTCSITHQKKSVIGCSIPNRLSLEAF